MSDLISRQAAIDVLTKDKIALIHIINRMSGHEKEFDRFMGQRNQVDCDIYAIKQLPSAQPEQRKGKWKDFWGSYQCSCCNMTNAYEDNFCPNCGADMRGDKHKTD